MNVKNLTGLAFAVVPTLLAIPATAEDYSGHTAVLGYAETITDPLSGEAGRVVWFHQDLGNRQLPDDFVYDDPRRRVFNGDWPGVTFGVKAENTSGDENLLADPPTYWMYESIDTWNREQCADLTLSENLTTPGLPGVVDLFFQTGLIFPIWEADLTQVGFRSGVDFSFFANNPNVLGVTFTLVWVDAQGNLTDIDANNKFDVAFREIYYNDDFEWADNGLEGPQLSGPRLFDLPTVAIHEVGHGLSSDHFGSIGRKDGFLFAKPHAVMNAIYGGTLRELQGSDVAGHCSNWAQWPNN